MSVPSSYSPGRRLRVVAVIAAAVVLPCGCADRAGLYRDLEREGEAALEAWRADRTGKRTTSVFLRGRLSLANAVKLALRHNPHLLATVQERAKARGRVLESYGAALPSVELEGTYSRLDSRHNTGAAFLDDYGAELTVTQPLFRGGAIPGALRAARLYACLADETVRQEVQEVIFRVISAYYDALLAEHLYRVSEDAVKSARAHLEDVKRRKDVGEAAKFDVLRAQVDVSNFRTDMIKQRNREAVAKALLLRLMGVSQQSEVSLADSLKYCPMRPVLEQAVKLALLRRPDLFRARLGIRLQREAVRIAKSKYWPTLAAFLVQGLHKPDPHEPRENHWGDQWTAGLALTWDLFDGLAREGKVRQEQATLRQRKIALRDAREQALFEIRQAILRLRDQEEAVESQRLNLARAKEALRLAEEGYREGVTTEVAVTDARAALTRARGLYYQAVHDHAIARLELQRAMGVLAPEPGHSAAVPPSAARVPAATTEEFSK